MKGIELTTLEEIKVYCDPYRLQIIKTFHRFGRPATVKEIADQMGEVPAKIHYHVKKLEKIGIVTLLYTKEIRGIVAKYYEAYDGEVSIINQHAEPSIKKLMFSHTEKVFDELFEQNKNKFIAAASEPEDSLTWLRSKTLYMTPEEMEQIRQTLYEIGKKYEKPREAEHLEEFQLFIAFSKQGNDNPKNEGNE